MSLQPWPGSGAVFNQDAYELRFTADHELGGGWRGNTGLQYVDVDFEAIGAEAFVPSSKTQTMSLFPFEEGTSTHGPSSWARAEF